MTKYSYELKKEIVIAYLSGKGSTHSLAKDYGILYGEDLWSLEYPSNYRYGEKID
ncbi:MAG: hypothetical protein ACI4EQ_00440 [Lachnospiraceae bacterium]